MKIEKKSWLPYFDEIKSGKKKFELRLADFRINPGDTLVLREWNPKKKDYTGRTVEKKVSFVVRTKGQKFYTKKEIAKYGFQVLQLK